MARARSRRFRSIKFKLEKEEDKRKEREGGGEESDKRKKDSECIKNKFTIKARTKFTELHNYRNNNKVREIKHIFTYTIVS